ncbi:MAG TPA: phosphonate C-P lyase system protein PhnG [Stellaceae bacterium]|nr:phosphonate C-P lyase system protein PhnG [Stellaceae bacterium]
MSRQISDSSIAARRRWMGILAKSPRTALERAWDEIADKPAYRLLRAPEIGLAMVRGRIAGTGEPFNLGELTMTRAAVQITGPGGLGVTGYGHVAGRDPRHAELAALFDAMLQRGDGRVAAALEDLAAELAAARAAKAAKVAPSRVEFFTLVRGE